MAISIFDLIILYSRISRLRCAEKISLDISCYEGLFDEWDDIEDKSFSFY